MHCTKFYFSLIVLSLLILGCRETNLVNSPDEWVVVGAIDTMDFNTRVKIADYLCEQQIDYCIDSSRVFGVKVRAADAKKARKLLHSLKSHQLKDSTLIVN